MSFMEPFSQQEAETCFQKVIAGLAARDRILLGAFGSGDDAGDLWGTVQILTVMPPNQSHRADIAKLLVHRAARGQGIGEALMRAAEDHARAAGKSLLVLDTAAGGPAERLYEKLGWSKAGIVPNYAHYPDGSWCDTTIFWKSLLPTPYTS